ncbi:MAG: hypothetical protein HOC71_00485 [Candidatus Latescibacteria bacterium]|nr:hypothetical protein [Candidatus Latescibacterota bacterium]
MFFPFLIRFLLLWWILSVIFKWVGKLSSSGKTSGPVTNGDTGSNDFKDIPMNGAIEDAEFEEIDGQ